MRTATTVQDNAVAQPTLDEFMDRDPQTLTADDLVSLVDILRADRSRFLAEQAKKKEG